MKIKFGLLLALAILLTSGLVHAQDATPTLPDGYEVTGGTGGRTTDAPCDGHYLSFEMGDANSADGLQTVSNFYSGSKSLVYGFDDLTGMAAVQDDKFSFTIYFGSADVYNKSFNLENTMEVPAGALATFPLDPVNHPYILVMMDCKGPSDITVTTTKSDNGSNIYEITIGVSQACITSRQLQVNGVMFPKLYTFENEVITYNIFNKGGNVMFGVVYQGQGTKTLTTSTIWGHWFSDNSTGIAQGISADDQQPDVASGSGYLRTFDALTDDVLSAVVSCN